MFIDEVKMPLSFGSHTSSKLGAFRNHMLSAIRLEIWGNTVWSELLSTLCLPISYTSCDQDGPTKAQKKYLNVLNIRIKLKVIHKYFFLSFEHHYAEYYILNNEFNTKFESYECWETKCTGDSYRIYYI